MGSDLTDGDSLQGVIIPDQRLTFWSSQSSGVTEASPYPGVVTPDRTTRATVTASGTPEDQDTIYLRALQGGITGYSGARLRGARARARTGADGMRRPASPITRCRSSAQAPRRAITAPQSWRCRMAR